MNVTKIDNSDVFTPITIQVRVTCREELTALVEHNSCMSSTDYQDGGVTERSAVVLRDLVDDMYVEATK